MLFTVCARTRRIQGLMTKQGIKKRLAWLPGQGVKERTYNEGKKSARGFVETQSTGEGAGRP